MISANVPLLSDKNRRPAYLKNAIDSSTTIKDLEYFTRIAMSMPGKRKVKEVMEGQQRHF
jgi:hypothetical protein